MDRGRSSSNLDFGEANQEEGGVFGLRSPLSATGVASFVAANRERGFRKTADHSWVASVHGPEPGRNPGRTNFDLDPSAAKRKGDRGRPSAEPRNRPQSFCVGPGSALGGSAAGLGACPLVNQPDILRPSVSR